MLNLVGALLRVHFILNFISFIVHVHDVIQDPHLVILLGLLIQFFEILHKLVLLRNHFILGVYQFLRRE